LGAAAIAIASGEHDDAVFDVLTRLEGVPGRVERAGMLPNGAAIYVDYAHTPDALETILRALRPHAEGRLLVVFGCGGDRDAGKRPLMGAVAHRLADLVVVTDDNPRGENAAAIRRQVLDACPGAREIGPRAEAIGWAIGALAPGDVLVLAGKGHERTQTIGAEVLPFDDVAVSRAEVVRLGGAA
jgi:UDP-N-acetylmuramoyl-L-alanyl-D-glutamate--2,6-diaminopimelate ligase